MRQGKKNRYEGNFIIEMSITVSTKALVEIAISFLVLNGFWKIETGILKFSFMCTGRVSGRRSSRD